ncbi:protein ARABIDILLO 2-like [Apium graveolens]|uniref:protein ARABIDILLO 2-like n=1 Tax=Apium graveolens TaxID=4045 RepID=UPI003D7995E4
MLLMHYQVSKLRICMKLVVISACLSIAKPGARLQFIIKNLRSFNWDQNPVKGFVAWTCKKLLHFLVSYTNSLSGIKVVDGVAFDALARCCQNLSDISLLDCVNVDLKSLEKIESVRFLSVAGTLSLELHSVSEHWSKLPNLECLDISQTDFDADAVLKLLSSSQSLKVVCAFDFPDFQEDGRFVAYRSNKDKLLITPSTDIFTSVASLFCNATVNERYVSSNWRTSNNKDQDLNEVMNWLEWILSLSLVRIAKRNAPDFNNFWLDQGVALSVCLAESLQEDVQEHAAMALGNFVFNDERSIYSVRCAAVIREGGILKLLHLSKSWREVLQSVAVKALSNLSVNYEAADAIAECGISIVINLTRSTFKSIAEDAATVLWNVSAEEHTDAIAEAGGLQALIDLIFKWPIAGDAILECAVAALANMAVNYKYCMLAIELGGLNALVSIVQRCKYEGALEQVARALGNIAAHDNISNAAPAQEVSALEVLMQLTRSLYDGVREAVADGLMNLSVYHRKGAAVAAAGGVEALVSLANSWSDASQSLKEKAAFMLWGLSVSKTNSIAIGR